MEIEWSPYEGLDAMLDF